MLNTSYYLGRHDDILCLDCGKNVDGTIQCINKMYITLKCTICGNDIPFVGQRATPPALEISHDEAASLSTFYSGIEA